MALIRSLLSLVDRLLSLAAALLMLLIGLCFALLGLSFALWVGLVFYRTELAFDGARWAVENIPLPWTVAPVQFANDMLQRDALIGIALAAFMLCLLGFGALRSVLQSLRPADQSSDGKGRIVLKAESPRVGVPLEGFVVLLAPPMPEQVFRLVLRCRRRYRQGDRDREETAYQEQRDIQVLQNAEGWVVPFRFEIPASAPPSAAAGLNFREGFHWHLDFYRADTWISFMPGFGLTLGPATAAELRALEDAETPEQRVAIAAVARALGRTTLLPNERAQIDSLSPADLAQVEKIAAMPAKMMLTIVKWFFIVFFGLPVLGAILFFVASAFLAGRN